MKIKKRDMRKGLAQLPINYPAPTVDDVFIFEREKHRVEDICKKLAHVEVEVRDAALAEMPRYLQEVCNSYTSSKGAVADADVELLLQKLAMGLFYCYWHSDKPLVQHECAHKIAQLMGTVPNPNMQRFIIELMFRILSREWGRIDRYWLDKYMALVRKLVFQMLTLVKRHYGEALKKAVAEQEEEAASKKKKDDEAAENDNAATTSTTDDDEVAADKILLREQAEQQALQVNFIQSLKTFFQQFLLVEPRSVGLTLHMQDIILDELIRSDVDVAVFVFMSEALPMFSMSKGDFVEKRVLDYFIGPIVAGVLDARRVHTIGTSPEEIKAAELKTRKNKSKKGGDASAPAERNYSDENDQICLRLATVCQQLSVAKTTRHHVRPLISEAQMLLEQRLAVKLNPKQFRRLTFRDMRRRVTQELREADDATDKTMKMRKIVKDEKRDAKKKARKLVAREQDGVGKKKFGKKGGKKGSSSSVDSNDADATSSKKQKQKGTKKADKKSQNKKRITIADSDAVGHEVSVKRPLKIDPATAMKVRKQISSTKDFNPKVKEELVKMARREIKNQAKNERVASGESESKLSTKGIAQNSKRHKYGKLTKADIIAMEKEETPTWKKKK